MNNISMSTKQSWHKGKTRELLCEVLSGVFSLFFIKSIVSSFAYYIHEHVIWRKKIKYQGDSRIHSRASIRNAQNIYLGNNVRITMDCCIWAEQNSKIIFGDNVLVGPGAKMFCGNHGAKLNGVPMVYQERTEKDITIGNDVWIGTGATIINGVDIGDGAVIGANTIVTKNVPPYSIVIGNPGKVLKKRFSDDQITKLLNLKWWDLPLEIIRKNFEIFKSDNIDECIIRLEIIKKTI